MSVGQMAEFSSFMFVSILSWFTKFRSPSGEISWFETLISLLSGLEVYF